MLSSYDGEKLKTGELTGLDEDYNFISIDDEIVDHQVTVWFGTDNVAFQGVNRLHLKVHLEAYPEVLNDKVNFELILYN